jgi:hypothetical protein
MVPGNDTGSVAESRPAELQPIPIPNINTVNGELILRFDLWSLYLCLVERRHSSRHPTPFHSIRALSPSTPPYCPRASLPPLPSKCPHRPQPPPPRRATRRTSKTSQSSTWAIRPCRRRTRISSTFKSRCMGWRRLGGVRCRLLVWCVENPEREREREPGLEPGPELEPQIQLRLPTRPLHPTHTR